MGQRLLCSSRSGGSLSEPREVKSDPTPLLPSPTRPKMLGAPLTTGFGEKESLLLEEKREEKGGKGRDKIGEGREGRGEGS